MSILSTIISRGLRSAQPAASGAPAGSLYYVTDEKVIERSTGSAWESFSLATTDIPTDATLAFTDITTNNSSTTKHGFLKKLSNAATDYMDGTGNWSVPAGGSATTFPNPSRRFIKMQLSDSGESTMTSGKDTFGGVGSQVGSGIGQGAGNAEYSAGGGRGYEFLTTSVSGNTAGWVGGSFTKAGYLPAYEIRFSTAAAVTNWRVWLGLASASSGLNQDTATATKFIGFSFRTGLSQTNWMATTELGDSTNQTMTSTGVAVAANTMYTLRFIVRSTTSVDFYVNGTLTNNLTTNINTTTLLLPLLYHETLSANTRDMLVGSLWAESD